MWKQRAFFFCVFVVQSTSSFQIRLAAYIHRGENNNNKKPQCDLYCGGCWCINWTDIPWGKTGWWRTVRLIVLMSYGAEQQQQHNKIVNSPAKLHTAAYYHPRNKMSQKMATGGICAASSASNCGSLPRQAALRSYAWGLRNAARPPCRTFACPCQQ